MSNGQTDRFGNPIPNDPGYAVIINPDGSQPQMRTTVFLAGNLVAYDDPNSQATVISDGGAPGFIGGIYELKPTDLDITGATPVNTQWVALLSRLMTLGYRGIDQTGAILKFTYNDILIPKRAQSVGFEIIGGTYIGTGNQNGPFGPNVRISADIGVIPESYGVHTWTGAISVGQTSFTGVGAIGSLTVGQYVFVRLGADPANINGAYTYYYAKILSITPTGGGAGTVVVDTCPVELPINPLPLYNLNEFRTATQHDMLPVVGFQDDLIFTDPIFQDMTIFHEQSRNCQVVRPTVNSGSFIFRCDQCFGLKYIDPFVKEVTAYEGGAPYSPHYGFLLTNYGSIGTEIRNLYAPNVLATGGVLDEEEQARGTHFTGTTRVTFNNTAIGGFCSAFTSEQHLEQDILIDHLIVGGGPNFALNSRNVKIGDLELGYLFVLGQDMRRVGTMRNSDPNGGEWSQPTQCDLSINPATNATTDFVVPLHGYLRSIQVYSSTLTGVTDVLLVRQDGGTSSILSYLTTGAWGNPDRFITDGAGGFANVNLWNGGTQDGESMKIRVVTDNTYPAAGYFIANIEMFLRSRNLGDGAYVNTSVPTVISTNGAPTANAAGLFQSAFDKTNKKWYQAVSVGSGAADWQPLGGVTYSHAAVSHQFLTGLDSSGNVTAAQPAFADVSGLGSAATQASSAFDAAGAAAAAQAASQPLNTQLTAISGVATVPFGRNLLTVDSYQTLTAFVGEGLITRGTNLTNGSETINVTQGSCRFLPPAVLTADCTKIIATTGAVLGDMIRIVRTDSTAHTMTFLDDGGITVLYTFPASVEREALFVYNGVHFALLYHFALTP